MHSENRTKKKVSLNQTSMSLTVLLKLILSSNCSAQWGIITT